MCVCELEFVSASGAAMFHLVNITQPAPPLHCHHHHNWQLAGYMLVQLPRFGPQRERENERERRNMKIGQSVCRRGERTQVENAEVLGW